MSESKYSRVVRRRVPALLISGHELERLFEVGDEFHWITGGSTHAIGTKEQARKNPAFRKDYIGRPMF